MSANQSAGKRNEAAGAKRLLWIAVGIFLLVNAVILIKVFLPTLPGKTDLEKSPAAEKLVAGKTVFNPETSAEFTRAAQSTRLFRDADRIYRFDAVLITGDPNAYRDLLKYLGQSEEWVLTHIDHASIVFQHPPAPKWQPDDLPKAQAEAEKKEPKERARYEVQLAVRLLAVGRRDLAKSTLDRALKDDPKSHEAWTALATWDGTGGNWRDALDHAIKALTLKKNYAPALAMKAEAHFSMGKFDEAFLTSNQLVRGPEGDNPQYLFLHARIAHQARAFTHEIEALQKLIAKAEKEKAPTSGYRIYLAQAYARRGDAADAAESLKQFRLCLAAGDLTEEQEKFVRETIESIESQLK